MKLNNTGTYVRNILEYQDALSSYAEAFYIQAKPVEPLTDLQ